MSDANPAIIAARAALEDELEYRSPKGTLTSWDDARVARMLAREPVLAREVLRLAELVGPDEVPAPVDLGTRRAAPPTEAEVTAWVRTLCRRAGLRIHLWSDGSSGLVNVPAKYVAVIDAMHVALLSIAAGEGLPEFAAPSAARTSKKARRR